MSEIEKLIQELCPEGVPFKKLGEIGSFIRGNGLQKKDFTNSGFPCIHYGQIHTYYNLAATKTISFTSEELGKKLKHAQKGDLIIATTSEDVDGCCKAIVWLGDKEVAISGDAYIYRHNQNPKFISYIFQTERFLKYKRTVATGTKVVRVSGNSMSNFEIPVPPLEVQQKIVEILDNFTSLTAELEAELEARKRQYEYYRNLLLTFNPVANGAVTGGEQQIGDGFTPPIKSLNIKYLSLGKMGKFIRGKYLQKRDFVNSGYPCIHYGQLYTYYGTSADKTISFVSQEVAEKSSIASKNDLLITLTSENEDDVCKPLAWLGEEDIAVSGHMVIYKHNQNPKYLSYLLQSEQFFIDKRKIAHGTKVIEVKPDNLAKIVVPIPPLDEQERIVAILDSFETLVNDLTAGLPAEIEARRKQYEYYRNKLLTFKKIA